MKRIGLLLILLFLFLAACASGGADKNDQAGIEEPPVGATAPTATIESAGETAGNPETEAGDPKAARDGDWKLGNTVDPAVTIIEYGDFQ